MLVVDLLKHIEVVTGVDDLIEQIRMVVAKLHAPLARHIDRLPARSSSAKYWSISCLVVSLPFVFVSSMPELRLTTRKQAASCLEVEHQQPYGSMRDFHDAV